MLYSPRKLFLADGSGERPVYPETTTITDGGATSPFPVGQLYKAVTVVVTPTNAAGTADIYARPANSDPWYLLTSIDMTTGGKSERLETPSGQLRVVNNGNSGITVSVEGLVNS